MVGEDKGRLEKEDYGGPAITTRAGQEPDFDGARDCANELLGAVSCIALTIEYKLANLQVKSLSTRTN